MVIHMTKNEFFSKWLEIFASNIPNKAIEKYVKATGNYIWHVFSWELLDKNLYLTGEAAKKAYDNIDKREAVFIDWFEDEETKDITWDLKTANAFDGFAEVYVVDKDFKWTYIKTHENMCGPYFMKRN